MPDDYCQGRSRREDPREVDPISWTPYRNEGRSRLRTSARNRPRNLVNFNFRHCGQAIGALVKRRGPTCYLHLRHSFVLSTEIRLGIQRWVQLLESGVLDGQWMQACKFAWDRLQCVLGFGVVDVETGLVSRSLLAPAWTVTRSESNLKEQQSKP